MDSFRDGVAIWINDLLNADLYIAPPAIEDGGERVDLLAPAALTAIRNTPGVAAVSTYRGVKMDLDGRPITLIAVDLAPQSQTGYRLLEGDPDTVWRQFATGKAVLISEPLAYRRQWHPGDRVLLPTPAGPKTFAVAGVFLDYGSEHGRILLHHAGYARYWHDSAVGSAAVFIAAGQNPATVRHDLQVGLGTLQALVIRANREIQQFTLDVFDRTFLITGVLRLLAMLVAVVGILSALLALQLERAREFAVLRATGMTVGEIGSLAALQTGLMGAMAGLLAIPTGLLLAAVLIFVINRRAFGWSLPFEVSPWLLPETVVPAILAALVAGIYPIWRMARVQPAAALRTD